jgi:hypothetical protein
MTVRMTILHVKILHTVVFWLLTVCVLYALLGGVLGHITTWTWVAVGFVGIEGVVLMSFGWICPLTILAERLGASSGSVADIFLPKWFADLIFPICGRTFLLACILILGRLLGWS